MHQARGHGDVRVTGDGRRGGATSVAAVAIDVVGEPSQTRGGSDQGLELVLGTSCVNALAAGEANALGARLTIRRVGERALFLGFQEQFLAEMAEFASAILFV